jgi:hypothetical protein
MQYWAAAGTADRRQRIRAKDRRRFIASPFDKRNDKRRALDGFGGRAAIQAYKTAAPLRNKKREAGWGF